MPTKRSVSDVKANLLRPALTSHFEVTIGVPNGLRGFLPPGNTQGQLNLMCSEAVLPGSALATIDINNDFQGVTERHAYRRQFDQSIDLTFYVDAKNYIPVKFFEGWISFVMNETRGGSHDSDLGAYDYSYGARYPDGNGDGQYDQEAYTATGLTVTKFERDYKSQIQYEFVKSFPLAITSMPVSYEASSLLKVSVQMTYIRYILLDNQMTIGGRDGGSTGGFNPFQIAQFNAGGIRDAVANFAGNAVRDAVGNLF